MNENESYKDYIIRIYDETYSKEILIECQKRKNGVVNDASRLLAQRKAIDAAFISSLIKYTPEVAESDLWEQIGITHKLKVAQLEQLGIDSEIREDVMKRCVSAHQSWIKSGGHSFERYISNISNEDLQNNEIKFILQSDLTKMIKNNELSNTKKDIDGLKSWGKDFDLYAIQSVHGETRVFGCIQSKTSIRDRVGRDVTFSNNAMDNSFWSVAITLDGAFLKMPEFINMVNGGASYKRNGWHGMYAMSGITESNGRIYMIDEDMGLFIQHAIIAAKQFIADRRQLNAEWRAQ